MEEKIKKIILEIAIEIAKEGKGALFVIGDKVNYEETFPQIIKKGNIFEQGMKKVLKSVGTLDGAVIIDNQGNLVSYGAIIKNIEKPYYGFGTRHAASIEASKNGNICILCSEEEHKVKIFRDGKYLMEIDALAKGIEEKINNINEFFESAGVGALATIGVSTIVPAIGLAVIPGIIIFGSSHYLLKYLSKLSKKSERKI